MSKLIIIKRDGTQTSPMDQETAIRYLCKPDLVHSSYHSNVKQVLNDVFTESRGKASGDLMFQGNRILHASAGNMQSSVSAFFYRVGTTNYLVALGEHINGDTYELSIYGQTNGDFEEGKKVRL